MMDSARVDTRPPKALPSVLINLIPSLQCPICLTMMKDPKLIFCGHTFCQTCLSKIECRNERLECPLCRFKTQINNGSVAQLPTNLALKSVIDEAIHLEGKCDFCHTIVNPCSLSYCYDCSASICSLCSSEHTANNVDHFIKSPLTSRCPSTIVQIKCDVHFKRPCKYICLSCNKYCCRECSGTHEEKRHETQEINTYKARLQLKKTTLEERIKTMKSKSPGRVEKHEYVKHTAFAHIEKLESQINGEYHTLGERLFEEKSALIGHCSSLKEEISKRFDDIFASINESDSLSERAISDVNDISKYPFKSRPTSMLSKLDEIDKKTNDSKQKGLNTVEEFRSTVENSFMVRFEKNLKDKDDLIGKLTRCEWVKKSMVLKHREQSMTCTAVDRQGRVFIGYFKGGVDIVGDSRSDENIHHLNGTCVMAMTFSCEGNLILRNTDNCIFVYGHAYKKLNVEFDTIGYEEGGYGDLAVNGKDDIYVSYRDIQKINAYRKTGGKAFRTIHCTHFNPQQILVMKTSDIVVMNGPSIRLIDVNGKTKSSVIRKGFLGYPAVSSDGKLYIAWVNHQKERIEIVQYTSHNDLKSYETLHKDETIDLSGRRWYYFQVIGADKLAFCTPKELHVFTLDVRPCVNKSDEGVHTTRHVHHFSQYGALERHLSPSKLSLLSCTSI